MIILNLLGAAWAVVCLLCGALVISGWTFEKVCRAFRRTNSPKGMAEGGIVYHPDMDHIDNLEYVAIQYADGSDGLYIRAKDGLTLCVSQYKDCRIVSRSDGRVLALSAKPISIEEYGATSSAKSFTG